MEKFILLLVGFVAFTGLTDGDGLLPDNMTAAEGGTVMFTTVSPPDGTFIVVSWLFGAKGIIIATPDSNTPAPDYEGRVTIFFDTGSLELRNLALNDSGEYTVRIITAAGEHTGTTTLKVIERISNPSITPTTNVAIEGNNFNLTCDVAAGSMLTRKWLKDGSDLTLSDNITLHDDNRVLSFQPLNRANNGEYTCNISNPISTMEAKYTLPVNYGADNVQIKGESKINSGDTFTLTCSAESEPSASFTWTLNRTVVHNSAEYKKKAEPSDSGNYTCQAKNSITGRSSSAMHGLTVIERISNPSITPTTNVAIEGNNFNLTCDVAAGSMLTWKWLKDGSDLTLSDNITLHDDNRVLSFQPLNRANRGKYTCTISNPISTMEAEYTLVVNYGADNVQIKGESKINLGDTFTLTCSAESEPSASFTWTLNGKVVHNSAVYKKTAEPSDGGNYTCQAKNSVTGGSSSAIHGLIIEPKREGGCNGGCIAGIVIAVLVVVGAAGGGGYYLYKKKKGQKQSSTPRGGRDGGQDNTNNSGNKELNYADIRVFHKKDGDAVQMGTQNETTQYAQVRRNNNPPAASSLPDYDAHVQRNRGQAPQPDANGAQLYSQIRKN